MIEVKGLTKKYGAAVAVENLSFKISAGEVVGFLGPNGAGKSTTMNIITGYISSNEGEITVDGFDVMENPNKVKERIGYLPETPPLYQDMTVKEYLNFMYELKRVTLPRKKHIQEVCEMVKISDVYNRVISHLSKGYKQRVGIAQALLGNPPVLILDEPTVGLDPKQIIEIRSLISSLGKKHTVILSSHILSEIQAVCNRVIIINQGKIVADGAPESLGQSIDGVNTITVRVAGLPKEIHRLLSQIPDVKWVKDLGQREPGANEFEISAAAGVDIRYSVFNILASQKHAILSMRSSELTLEDVFLKITYKGGTI